MSAADAVDAAVAELSVVLGEARARALLHMCVAVHCSSALHAAADADYAPEAQRAADSIVESISAAVAELDIHPDHVSVMASAVARLRGAFWHPPTLN